MHYGLILLVIFNFQLRLVDNNLVADGKFLFLILALRLTAKLDFGYICWMLKNKIILIFLFSDSFVILFHLLLRSKLSSLNSILLLNNLRCYAIAILFF